MGARKAPGVLGDPSIPPRSGARPDRARQAASAGSRGWRARPAGWTPLPRLCYWSRSPALALVAIRREPSFLERLPMQGPFPRPAMFALVALGFGAVAGCSRPLGIVQKASDGAEALTNRAEETFKDTYGKVDAFGDRLKEKVKDLGDDLTTWKDEDEAVITPTSAVRVDQGPIVR